jgi:hypothetical protein
MRVRFPLEMRWEGLSGRHTSRIYDISLSGCYVETLGEVQTGERVRFGVQSPTGRWLTFEGEVAHHQPNMGFGLRFVNLSETQRDVLTRLIDYADDEAG